MAIMSKHPLDGKNKSADRFSSDLEDLKSNFTQLREDVTKLLASALGAGRNGAGALKAHASSAVVDLKDATTDLKDCGVESVEKIGQKIGERPLLSAAIAMGIGYVLAKLLARR
jgi:ElaB/YqjD/DUF883 family membrane-anchored ribosome-binding protein